MASARARRPWWPRPRRTPNSSRNNVTCTMSFTHREAAAAEAQLQAIVEENNACCASYASSTNYLAARWDDDSAGTTTSTGDGQGADSSKNEQGMGGGRALCSMWANPSLVFHSSLS